MSGSGFAGLGYQVVWTQQFSVWLGHEWVAMLAVVAAFFGGLALGARLLSRVISRSTRPALWYAGCEATMALWAIVLTACIPSIGSRLITWIGLEPSALRHWTLAFAGPLFVLLPSTIAMGATLPAIERVTNRLSCDGYAIGALYAANTAGAVLGVLSCAFFLVPLFGLKSTAYVCACLNAACAVVSLLLWREQQVAPVYEGSSQTGSGILFLTGLLGIGYEVLVVRVLSGVMEDTVYTFAILLAVYLFGTAIGGAIYQRWFAAGGWRARLFAMVAGACMLSIAALWAAPMLKELIKPALVGEAVVACVAFLLPAIAMGMLFSDLSVEAKSRGVGLGNAIAANTLGGAVAPLIFGVLLLPTIGPKISLIAIAVSYALLAGPIPSAVMVTAGIALAVFAPSLAFVNVPPGGRLVRYEEGVSAAVSVIQDANGVATLHIDNRQQEGSSATLQSDARQAWIPLLLHPHPQRALFLGLGTGLTAGSASWDSKLQVDAVELVPEVVKASANFAPVLNSVRSPHIVIADARRFVRANGPQYDVVIADLFHPARNGAGALYTAEHFAAVRARLAPGGLFCQWLPIHQLDLDSLRSVVAAFLTVYPNATALLATNSLETPVLGLIGTTQRSGFQTRQVHSTHLQELHLDDELAVLGSFVAGPESLSRFSAGAPVNTDDHPVVIHRAPYLTYAKTSEPRDRLVYLLHAFNVKPEDVLDPRDTLTRARLTAYWAARTRFIEVGTQVQLSDDVRIMLGQVRAPLLQILRASPDFRPAYDPLLNMAAALSDSDSDGARALLKELDNARPERPEARLLLQQLASASATPRT